MSDTIDIEKVEQMMLLPNEARLDASFFRPVAGIVATSLALIGMIAVVTSSSSLRGHHFMSLKQNHAGIATLHGVVAADMLNLAAASVWTSKGPQKILDGCVNLYGSNPIKFVNTDVLTICNTKALSTKEIDIFGFSPKSANHGITYLETGKGAWLTLFTGKDFTDASFVIPPENTIDLTFEKIGQSSDYWNDATLSLKVQGGKSSTKLGANAIMYQVHHNQILPDDSCIILYGANPLSGPDTTGVVACGDPSQQHWVFPRDLIDNWGFELKKYSGGVSYVRVGKSVSLTLFSGSTPDESLFNVTIPAGHNQDLTQLPLGPHQGTWNDVPISFALDYPANDNDDH